MRRYAPILLIFLAGTALGQSDIVRPPTEWIADANNRCKVANAYPSAAEAITWSGECKDGYADGEGVAQWYKAKQAMRKRYEGEMHGGFMDGKGKFTFADGDVFEGMFKNGTLNGKGSARWINKNHYEGDWKDGYPSGQGTYTWASGSRYTGGWLNGKQNGQGDFKFVNGDHYVGEFKDGLMDGQGKFTWSDGNVYIGEYRNDKPNGKGTVRFYAVSVSHTGIFKDGCMKDGDQMIAINQSVMSCELKLSK